MRDESSSSSGSSTAISLLPPIYFSPSSFRPVRLLSSLIPPPSSLISNSARVRAPDVLVHLQLHPKFHSAFGDPIRQFSQINLAPGRRDQDCSSAPFEVVLSDYLEGEVPVSAISNHKLYFVEIGAQQTKIGPVISLCFARTRALDVQNYLCA